MRKEIADNLKIFLARFGLVSVPAAGNESTGVYFEITPTSCVVEDLEGEEGTNGKLLFHRMSCGVEDWVLLEWAGSEEGGQNWYDILAHGNLWLNMAGYLEPRHTYFGDQGYVYMLDMALLTKGLERLRQIVMGEIP